MPEIPDISNISDWNISKVKNMDSMFYNTPKFKQYQRAKIDFSTAQLRQETGAVINESEIDWIDRTYRVGKEHDCPYHYGTL